MGYEPWRAFVYKEKKNKLLVWLKRVSRALKIAIPCCLDTLHLLLDVSTEHILKRKEILEAVSKKKKLAVPPRDVFSRRPPELVPRRFRVWRGPREACCPRPLGERPPVPNTRSFSSTSARLVVAKGKKTSVKTNRDLKTKCVSLCLVHG